ncbi:MAG: cytochrome c nitrite reductase small subunit [Deltaproteobacteria bacterium]|jgi:cytochrome c nitrite reductase small subunit|nr:cytochrome c nitrite reductase small subunit [Deltaproteobacteria bacterium]
MRDTNGDRQPGYRISSFFRRLLDLLPNKLVLPLFLAGGVIAGLGAYNLYVARAFSYLEDDPRACVNCHVMASYYQSWSRSSHAAQATCNECHVPQGSFPASLLFKAVDGVYHAAVFSARAEPQVIRPRDASSEVILENCIRCHTQLNTEFVKTGMVKYADVKNGRQKACWDCHRDLPHTRISNLASAPDAVVPFPASPVPSWLKAIME